MPRANENPRNLRREAGLTQYELALMTGLSRTTVSRLERGLEVGEGAFLKVANALSRALARNITAEAFEAGRLPSTEGTHEDYAFTSEAGTIATRLIREMRVHNPTYYGQLLSDLRLDDFDDNTLQHLTLNQIDFDGSVARDIINYIDEDEASFPETLSSRLLSRLATLGISEAQLAERLELGTVGVHGWLMGWSRPSKQDFVALSDLLGFGRGMLETLPVHPTESDETAQSNDADRRASLKATADAIPNQNPLIRFGVSENAKLHLVPSLNDENDHDTIEALRAELLGDDGPIKWLLDRYSQGANTEQAGLFGPLTSKYAEELSKEPDKINYTVLYARGARFYAARRTAARQVETREWPEASAEENDAIDAICDLHGPLIMASGAGRRLVGDAHEYETTPEAYRKEELVLREFGEALSSEAAVFEPDTADAIVAITKPIPDDPQPARSRGMRVVLAGSALSALVGGSAWYAAGGVVATIVVPAALFGAVGLGTAFAWEVTKKTERFKNATDGLARQADAIIDRAELHADSGETALLKRVSDLVERKQELFKSVAELRPEFGWAQKFINRPSASSHPGFFDVVGIVGVIVAQFRDRADKARGSITFIAPISARYSDADGPEFAAKLTALLSGMIPPYAVQEDAESPIPHWEIRVSCDGETQGFSGGELRKKIVVECSYREFGPSGPTGKNKNSASILVPEYFPQHPNK